MIRVVLPHHLRTLARVGDEVQLEVAGAITVRAILEALEAKYPALRGTIREHGTLKRRPLVRFFACEEDVSHEPVDTVLARRDRQTARSRFLSWARSQGDDLGNFGHGSTRIFTDGDFGAIVFFPIRV